MYTRGNSNRDVRRGPGTGTGKIECDAGCVGELLNVGKIQRNASLSKNVGRDERVRPRWQALVEKGRVTRDLIYERAVSHCECFVNSYCRSDNARAYASSWYEPGFGIYACSNVMKLELKIGF